MDRKSLVKILTLFLTAIVLAVITISVPARKITKQKAVLGTGAISLQPASDNLAVGEEKTVQIYLGNPSQKKITFVDIRLVFNKDILEITDFSPRSEAFPINLTANDSGLLGRTTGQAKLQAANSGTNPAGNVSILVGTMKIKGKAAGVSQITVNEANSQVVGENPNSDDLVLGLSNSQGGSYTVSGGATATPTLPAGSAPVLNFSIKFQGVAAKKADQKVKVNVKKEGVEREYPNVNVVADSLGVYSGSVILTGVPAGTGYKIFIKGPKHLAKKFCDNNQTTRCIGESRIVLNLGVNTYNFSKMVLEAGDLPDAGVQDGVVNSLDYSLWKARYGKEDAVSLAVADVDFDGVVGTGDWALMRITLETKYEEDN